MTYKEFIEAIRDIADHLEHQVKHSQVINFQDEISGDDDTLVWDFEMEVEELFDNATGVYGHSVVMDTQKWSSKGIVRNDTE